MRNPHRRQIDAIRKREPETWSVEECEAILRDDLARMRHERELDRHGSSRLSPWWIVALVLSGGLWVCGLALTAKRRDPSR